MHGLAWKKFRMQGRFLFSMFNTILSDTFITSSSLEHLNSRANSPLSPHIKPLPSLIASLLPLSFLPLHHRYAPPHPLRNKRGTRPGTSAPNTPCPPRTEQSLRQRCTGEAACGALFGNRRGVVRTVRCGLVVSGLKGGEGERGGGK